MNTSLASSLTTAVSPYHKLSRITQGKGKELNDLLLLERTSSGENESSENKPLDLDTDSGEISRPNFTPSKTTPPWIARICVSLWDKLDIQTLPGSYKVASGAQLITHLVTLSEKRDRMLASGAWQTLLEESAIQIVTKSSSHQTSSIYNSEVPEFLDSEEQLYRCTCPLDVPLTDEDEAISTNMRHKDENSIQFVNQKEAYARIRNDSLDLEDGTTSEYRFQLLLDRLYCLASAALLRRILAKPSIERTEEELEFVVQELMIVPALANFPNSVRNELSKCIKYEVHPWAKKLVFRQGDPGVCWYIIYKGSVWVHIKGQGYVCRLGEGDDFGKLALVTGDPRAASIILAEDNCHFLRVDKTDYDRVLLNVEANIVRLREGDSDVLILECVKDSHSQEKSTEMGRSSMNQLILAGTNEKILRHILDVRLVVYGEDLPNLMAKLENSQRLCPLPSENTDIVVEEYVMTLKMYSSTSDLFASLYAYASNDIQRKNTNQQAIQNGILKTESSCLCTRVLMLLYIWCMCIGLLSFASLDGLDVFLHDLEKLISSSSTCLLQQEAIAVLLNVCDQIWNPREKDTHVFTSREEHGVSKTNSPRKKSHPKSGVLSGTRALFTRGRHSDISIPSALQQLSHYTPHVHRSIYHTPYHLNRLRIEPHTLPFSSDNHSITFPVYVGELRRKVILTLPINTSVMQIKSRLASEMPAGVQLDEYDLVEVRSTGERNSFQDSERGVLFSLSPNSCIFLTRKGDTAKLAPLPIQLNVAMTFLDHVEPPRASVAVETQPKETKIASPKLKKTTSVVQRFNALEELRVDEIASIFTYAHIQLALCISPSELLDYTMGSEKSGSPTPHIRLLVTQFSLIHAWTITQIVTTPVLNKRAQVMKRLIKLADRLISAPFHDQHTCFAVVMALQSAPVTRLTQTWERIPVRWKRVFQNRLLPLIDPARNHRAARNWVAEHSNSCLPFLAIVLKDLRFAEDGNSTIYPQQQPSKVTLINFEKMRMITRTLRMWNAVLSGYEELHPFGRRFHFQSKEPNMNTEIQQITRTLQSISTNVLETFYEHMDCIDDLRMLNQLALRIEPKK